MIKIVYIILISIFIIPFIMSIKESSNAKKKKAMKDFSNKPLYPDEKPVIKETGPSKPADFPDYENVYDEESPKRPKIPDDMPVEKDMGPSNAKDFPDDVPVDTDKGASKQQDFPNYSGLYKTHGPSNVTEFPDYMDIYKEPGDESGVPDAQLNMPDYDRKETNELLLKKFINKDTLLNNIIFLEVLSKPVSMRKTR